MGNSHVLTGDASLLLLKNTLRTKSIPETSMVLSNKKKNKLYNHISTTFLSILYKKKHIICTPLFCVNNVINEFWRHFSIVFFRE